MRGLIKKILKESIEDNYIFYSGSENPDIAWDSNYTVGELYPFRWDEEDEAYWVRDNINSWRPFGVVTFNKLFSKYDYDQTSNMFESEEEFGWVETDGQPTGIALAKIMSDYFKNNNLPYGVDIDGDTISIVDVTIDDNLPGWIFIRTKIKDFNIPYIMDDIKINRKYATSVGLRELWTELGSALQPLVDSLV